MKVNGYNITDFVVTTYADMFHRKAVLAYTSDGECYGDVTINIPQYSLDEEESFLSADCPNLIDAIEYGIDIIPDEFGEKETLRKAVQMIKYRDKVLDLVLRLESGEVENYAENN